MELVQSDCKLAWEKLETRESVVTVSRERADFIHPTIEDFCTVDIVDRIRKEFERFPRIAFFVRAFEGYFDQIEKTIELTCRKDDKDFPIRCEISVGHYLLVMQRVRKGPKKKESESESDDEESDIEKSSDDVE